MLQMVLLKEMRFGGRALKGSQEAAKAFLIYILEDMNPCYRSRVVEMLVTCSRDFATVWAEAAVVVL